VFPALRLLVLLSGANFRAAHGGSKERGKDAEVEQSGQQRYQADDGHDNSASAMDGQQAQGNKDNACDNTSDAAGGGSHKLYEGVHFISPIFDLD
jgi:hypothetical protein